MQNPSKHTHFIGIFFLLVISFSLTAQQTVRQYLSGTESDKTVSWDFFCTSGRKSGKWTKIAVPSNWEQHGFGSYNYGHDKVKADEKGLYKTNFFIKQYYNNQQVYLVFEGSMTDTRVKINGKYAGALHQGAFNRFKYNITPFLRKGKSNLLEVEVSKMSSDGSVNDAERSGDYWVFGGIYRPVFLEIMPYVHIDHCAVDARADGAISAEVSCKNTGENTVLSAEVLTLAGLSMNKPFSIPVSDTARIEGKIEGINPWSAEFPNLYLLRLTIRKNNQVIHQTETRIGFRTIEVRKEEGIYLNGQRIILKGVNRHSTNTETGKSLSKSISIKDVNLIREMNMNAVRMAHYSPDDHFLDVCDSLGLYVLDELAGWQKKYDDTVGHKLVKELIEDDVNHPSVLFWDNGNEGGWNYNLDKYFALFDPQKRTVIHPWENIYGINTKHYPDYNMVQNTVLYSRDIYMPTEFMHGLYDGGHGAGLDDFWSLMLQHRSLGGGFLWDYKDEGISRTDKDGWIDTDGNHAADGILGPHYEKEASFFTIREIWSPISLDLKSIPADFNGKIPFENRYSFINTNQCNFNWKLKTFQLPGNKEIILPVEDSILSPDVAPGENGWFELKLPVNWRNYDALFLTARDPLNREIITWSWPLQDMASPVTTVNTDAKIPEVVETDSQIIVTANARFFFNKSDGLLKQVELSGKNIPFGDGPKLAGTAVRLIGIKINTQNQRVEIETEYMSEDSLDNMRAAWIFEKNMPVKLEYTYSYSEEIPFMGLIFNLPVKEIDSIVYIGQGPYRVWKNRMKGTSFGLWKKNPNNTITGETYIYPEFPGYYAGVRHAVFFTKSGIFKVSPGEKDIFLQLYRPGNPKGAYNLNTSPPFPDGDIGFLKAIPAIGTKFQNAASMGPQSQLNAMYTMNPIQGILYFTFE